MIHFLLFNCFADSANCKQFTGSEQTPIICTKQVVNVNYYYYYYYNKIEWVVSEWDVISKIPRRRRRRSSNAYY